MDRIGHRRLQFIGFSVMALCFVVLAIVPQLTEQVAPFLAILGLSYFFIQFGPNMTTFVLPSEVFPVSMRTTGHGVAAGIGKLGAFVGVFLVPVLQDHIGLRGLLAVAGVSAVLGFAVTGLLPEPAGRTLEDVADHRSETAAPGPVRIVATEDLTSRELKPPHRSGVVGWCAPVGQPHLCYVSIGVAGVAGATRFLAALKMSRTAAPMMARSSNIWAETTRRAGSVLGVMSPNPTVEKMVVAK